jgi:hypothetical protein
VEEDTGLLKVRLDELGRSRDVQATQRWRFIAASDRTKPMLM